MPAAKVGTPTRRAATNGHRKRKPNALIAAATRIKLDDSTEAQRQLRRYEQWQRDAWDYYDLIGEIKYASQYLGNAMSKVRIFAAERATDPHADPEPTEFAAAVAVSDRIQYDAPDLLRDTAINFQVAGEGFLIGREEDDGELWEVRSVDEIESSSGRVSVKGSQSAQAKELPEDAFFARMWLRHQRYADQPDSPLRGVLSSCEQVLLLERERRALSRSRIMLNGVIIVPDEATFPAAGDGEEEDDPFMSELLEIATTAIRNEGDASAVVPPILRLKGDLVDKFKHISFERPHSEQISKDLQETLRRLAQGLNVPVEIIMGLADLNHWNAWQVDENTFKNHFEPLLLQILDAFTVGYMWPTLREEGIDDPRKYLFWYDASQLVQPPDRTEIAHKAFVAPTPAISGAAYREVLGMSEEDAPSRDEMLLQAILSRGRLSEEATTALLRIVVPEIQVIDEPLVEPPALAAAGNSENLGRRLAAIDQTLRARLEVAASSAMRRTLEKVGAKLRTRVQKDENSRETIRGAANLEVARILGEALVAQIGPADEELELMFAPFIDDFDSWVESAQRQALAALDLTPGEEVQVAEEQETNRLEASAWLLAAIVALARSQLFGSSASSEVGEYDETLLVPPGLVREALARAGGAHGLETRGFFVSVSSNGGPLGGVAAGEQVQSLLAEKGWGIEAYEWEYGAFPRRTFEPHLELDGVIFESFSDPRLLNASGFPSVAYYMPGDHNGCRCDVIPVLVSPQLFPTPVVD